MAFRKRQSAQTQVIRRGFLALQLFFLLIITPVSAYCMKEWEWWQIALIVPALMIDNIGHSLERAAVETVSIKGRPVRFRSMVSEYHWVDGHRAGIKAGSLKENTVFTIQGQPLTVSGNRQDYPELTAGFYPDGSLAWGEIVYSPFVFTNGQKARQYTLNGRVEFYPDGSLKQFYPGRDSPHLLKAGQNECLLLPSLTAFYPGGVLESGTLTAPAEFLAGDRPVMAASNFSFSLYESGRLLSLDSFGTAFTFLAPEGRRNTMRFVSFFENGQTAAWYPSSETLVTAGAVSFRVVSNDSRPEFPLEYFSNGRVETAYPAGAVTFQTKAGAVRLGRAQAGDNPSRVDFDGNGGLREGFTAGPVTLKAAKTPYRIRQESHVRFYPDGGLRECTLDKGYSPVHISGLSIREDSELRFYMNGAVQSLIVGQAGQLETGGEIISLPDFSRVYFWPDSRIFGFEFSDSQELFWKGSNINVPPYQGVTLLDGTNRFVIDAVQTRLELCTLPADATLPDDPVEFWVRADELDWQDRKEYRVSGVREILFLQDETIIRQGQRVFCPAMTWVRL